VNGSFYFGEGEGGVRSITLTIYPHEEIEVEETFIIQLKIVKGEAKLDSRAKDVALTVSLTFLFPHEILNLVDLSENAFMLFKILHGYVELKIIKPHGVIIPVDQNFSFFNVSQVILKGFNILRKLIFQSLRKFVVWGIFDTSTEEAFVISS
jgi:hypothetical protein